jgi:two-component system, sensor histidine kinase and response regulator
VNSIGQLHVPAVAPSPAFDLPGMMQRIGDEDLGRIILADFLAEADNMLQDVRNAICISDAAQCRLSAHSLKGAALTVGAGRLAETAFALEKMARAGDLIAYSAALSDLECAFRELLPEIKQAIEVGAPAGVSI